MCFSFLNLLIKQLQCVCVHSHTSTETKPREKAPLYWLPWAYRRSLPSGNLSADWSESRPWPDPPEIHTHIKTTGHIIFVHTLGYSVWHTALTVSIAISTARLSSVLGHFRKCFRAWETERKKRQTFWLNRWMGQSESMSKSIAVRIYTLV